MDSQPEYQELLIKYQRLELSHNALAHDYTVLKTLVRERSERIVQLDMDLELLRQREWIQYKEKCQEIDRADRSAAFVQTLQKELREAREQIEILNRKLEDFSSLLNLANHSDLSGRRQRSSDL